MEHKNGTLVSVFHLFRFPYLSQNFLQSGTPLCLFRHMLSRVSFVYFCR